MTVPSPILAVGQIWREVDTRFDRFVRVEAVQNEQGRVVIRTVSLSGGRWIEAERSRSTSAAPNRFDGKRGNYELVELAQVPA